MFRARHLVSSMQLSSKGLHPPQVSPHPPSTSFSVSQRRSSRRLFSTVGNVGSRRIRVITCDVTGTLVSFLGKIEDHYGTAARTCGVELPPDKMPMIAPCFNRAYRETTSAFPCFGNDEISSKEWWRHCVSRSFELVGITMTQTEKDMVFQRVYSKFGSHATYGAFPDALPFLKWCHRRGIATGIISNADERYGDSILPMLDLGEEIRFCTFSKNVGYEKPSRRIFEAAMKQAEPWLCLANSDNVEGSCPPLKPDEVLHIGNDFKKDYVGATDAGFHAILLDRYGETELSDSWRQQGAIVFQDLIDVAEYLGREQFQFGLPRE